ncbi:50S ribosomal protein L25/general stress protein Ctc [Paenibacillus athensensis]|uniref:Large ribosomal subunit protein bL25 n=1 Tax=Paenibacillus athensensis TaxID=1967502 RepID=A0A4Y8PUV3_9BACL|nr:50S ribosomal protein L25/general stress protein Ctc [Paenibacillus athensensis]MCD1261891.1 50S ribosomal protein L25/general stress protein Ctc [Paenibacillus athensensis]
MVLKLKAEARNDITQSEIKQLRANGQVPGVVYGKKVGNTAIAIDTKELLQLLRRNPHAIIEMELPGGEKQPVMINELQRDKVSRTLLHVDFHQINMDEPVKTVVALEFVGEAKGAQEGGIVQVQLHELEIRCLPQHIPGSIRVDVSELGLGENLLVSHLSVPAEIEVKSDPNELVVTILAPQKEAVAEESAEQEAKGEVSAEKNGATADEVAAEETV